MAPGPNTTEQLLQAARAGSSEAVGLLLEGCRQYLLLIANQELDPALRGKVGASDVVQETFLDAQRDFGRFRGRTEEELLAWLRCILLNNLANVTRHYRAVDKRQISREVAFADVPAEQLREATGDERDSPRAGALARERDEALWAAIGRLPETARQVVLWRNYERLPFEEIGRRLDRSGEAARKVWTRALEQLQQLLESPDESG